MLHFGIGANIRMGDEAVPGPAIPAYRFHYRGATANGEPARAEGPPAAPHWPEARDGADQGAVLPTVSQQSVPSPTARPVTTGTLPSGRPSAAPASEAVVAQPASPGLRHAANGAPSPRKRPRPWDSRSQGAGRDRFRDVAVGPDAPASDAPLPAFLRCPGCGLGLAGSLVLPCGHALWCVAGQPPCAATRQQFRSLTRAPYCFQRPVCSKTAAEPGACACVLRPMQ